MKFCTKCGSSLHDGAAFCGKCGTKYDIPVNTSADVQPNTSAAQGENTNNPMALVGFILSCAGLLFLVLSVVDMFFSAFGTALGAGGLVFSIISKKRGTDKKNKLGFIFSIIALAGCFMATMIWCIAEGML